MTVKRKLRDLGPGEMYQRCDPFKIEEIMNCAGQIKDTNNFLRESLQKMGTSVQQLAKSSLDLQRDGRFHNSLNMYVQDLGGSIQQLNQLTNDIHYKVLQNDDKLG